MRRRYPGVAVAETGHLDLHRRAEIGVAVVSSTAAHATEVLRGVRAPGRGASRDRAAVGAAAAGQTRRSERAMDAARARKLADRIAQIVAEMLERRVKDPRLGFVTVTEARVTGDLREATVFYTVYGTRGGAGRDRGGAGQRHRPHPLRGRPADRPAAHPVARRSSRDALPENAQHIEDLVAQARRGGRGAGRGP